VPKKKSKAAAPAVTVAPPEPNAVPEPATTPWPSGGLGAKIGIVAGFVGVGIVGILIGRATSAPPETSPVPVVAPSGRASASPVENLLPPQQFDLAENPMSKSGQKLREMDLDILNKIVGRHYERTELEDVFPDRPYRVRFIGSAAEKHIGGVLIDLTRNGKWDERWRLTTNEVVRDVDHDPIANGMPVHYTLGHGRWQLH
jgi:hypothetical protein